MIPIVSNKALGRFLRSRVLILGNGPSVGPVFSSIDVSSYDLVLGLNQARSLNFWKSITVDKILVCPEPFLFSHIKNNPYDNRRLPNLLGSLIKQRHFDASDDLADVGSIVHLTNWRFREPKPLRLFYLFHFFSRQTSYNICGCFSELKGALDTALGLCRYLDAIKVDLIGVDYGFKTSIPGHFYSLPGNPIPEQTPGNERIVSLIQRYSQEISLSLLGVETYRCYPGLEKLTKKLTAESSPAGYALADDIKVFEEARRLNLINVKW